MNRRSIALPALLVSLAAFAVVACSDDDTEDTITPPTADAGADASRDAAAVTGAPQIAAVTLPALTALTAAEPVTFTATGNAPITWSISAGAAPAGMTLDPTTGVYAGTPTANGAFQLTVTATNAVGSSSIELTQAVGSPASDAYALLASNRIASFSTLLPSGASTPIALTGVVAGDVIVSIDRRPMNGFLYGLGINAGTQTGQIYAIDGSSGFAAPVGSTFGVTAAVGTTFGLDFNPTADRIRVVTSAGQNLRLDPNSGVLAATDTGLTAGGTTTGAAETAYTNSVINAAATTQYTLGATTKTLYLQNPPNGGLLTLPLPVAPAVDAIFGFDIGETVSVSTANTPVTAGLGHVGIRLTGQTADSFASINLVTGQLGVIGAFPFTGTLGLTFARSAARSVIGLTAAGQIVRFVDNLPATLANTTNATAITAGETLVGIDFRPATGQFYGLGINAVADTGTLYRIDPQLGAATVVGTAGSIAFAGADFPADGWGIDFNPSVDRIRVVTSSGLNFRVHPDTGASVDGDSASSGTQSDGAIKGGTTHIDGVAYTNGPSVLGPTAEYGIDSTTGGLYLFTDPNGGMTGAKIAITVAGAPLTFTAVNGFDIPSSVTTATANTAVTAGSAFASLVVGGATNLYRIDLVSGAATFVGAVGAGTTQLVGLAAGR